MKIMLTINEWILLIICILIAFVVFIFFIALIIDARRDYVREMRGRYRELEEQKKPAVVQRPQPRVNPHEVYYIDDRAGKARKLVGEGNKVPDGDQILIETHYRDQNGREQVKRVKK